MSRNWSSYAFGDKFDGHLTYEWPSLNDDGTYTMMEWRPRNFFAGFFDTGVTWNNNISVSGNNGKGTSVRVSVTDVRNDWIVPNTGYKQQTFSISLSQQINKYIKLDAKVNYYRKDSDNLPMTGYGGSSIMYPLLWNTPNVDAQWFKADYKKWVREGGDLSKSTQHVSANGNNPYYTAYEQLNKLDRDRVFGNLAATINFTEELSLILRCGMDLNNDFRTQQKPKGAKTYINGMYKEQTVFDYEMNNDFLLRYTKKLNDFDLSASFGGNNMMQSYRSNTSLAESLVVDRDYRLSNSVDRPKVTSIRRQKSINSFYGLISASWRNMIFLDVTGRTTGRVRWLRATTPISILRSAAASFSATCCTSTPRWSISSRCGLRGPTWVTTRRPISCSTTTTTPPSPAVSTCRPTRRTTTSNPKTSRAGSSASRAASSTAV